MPPRKDPNLKIRQISVGITRRQEDFLNKYPSVSVHEVLRNALDNQIKLIDKNFLKDE
jgi:hypothetical protein